MRVEFLAGFVEHGHENLMKTDNTYPSLVCSLEISFDVVLGIPLFSSLE